MMLSNRYIMILIKFFNIYKNIKDINNLYT